MQSTADATIFNDERLIVRTPFPRQKGVMYRSYR